MTVERMEYQANIQLLSRECPVLEMYVGSEFHQSRYRLLQESSIVLVQASSIKGIKCRTRIIHSFPSYEKCESWLYDLNTRIVKLVNARQISATDSMGGEWCEGCTDTAGETVQQIGSRLQVWTLNPSAEDDVSPAKESGRETLIDIFSKYKTTD